MKSLKSINLLHAAIAAIAGALVSVVLWNCEGASGGDTEAALALLRANPLPGAIFTTLEDGTAVNANIYEAKEDVYLDGGPGPNAPIGAAGLPEGDYFFQVTDPSGHELLSEDHISCRRFHVDERGVIAHVYAGTSYVRQRGDWVAISCEHATGIDADHGATTVQLMPYADTPNRGGVYKVWVTRVEDYVGDPDLVPQRPNDSVNGAGWEPGNAHGFVPSTSKTDNYKVNRRGPPFEPPILSVRKFHDRDLDGVQDEGEEEITGWRVGVSDPVGSTNNVFTPADVFASEGVWLTVEDRPAGTTQTVATLDGAIQSQYPTADPLVSAVFEGDSGEHHTVVYGNVGIGTVVACKVYDRDGDGVADEGEPPVPGWRFELTGTDVLGRAVGPVADVGGADGCAAFPGLLPGEYTITEGAVSGDTWHSTGETTFTLTVESTLDGGVLSGGTHEVAFTNYCTGSAAFGTKGYWHNRNGLAEMTDDQIAYVNGLAPYAAPSSYFGAGDEPFDGVYTDGTPVQASLGSAGEEIAPPGSARAEISRFLVDSNAGADPREQLAQQLLAFLFNAQNRLDDPDAAIVMPDGSFRSASDIVDEAIEAWTAGDAATRHAMASMLDGFNNRDDVQFVHWNPCDLP